LQKSTPARAARPHAYGGTSVAADGWGWLERARARGAIRIVDVGQATRNLFGVLLFDPALSRGFGDPDLPSASRRRKRAAELAAFLRGALEPR
jgi:hypothetical protein